MNRRRSVSHSLWALALPLACLGSTPSCSAYEPQGQFWSDSGPLTVGAGGSLVEGGASPAAAGASSNSGTSSGGAGNAAAGNYATGGVNPIAGSNSVAGSDSVAGSGSVGGNSSIGGNSPVGGASSIGGSTAIGGSNPTGGMTSQSCSLRVAVTTTAPGGNYQPRNVGAIWIADSSGKFVKSLEVWANKRISRVVAWNTATRNAGVAGNKVDAVTSATLSTHRTHNVSWNCRDYNGNAVPDGAYRVYFEVADSNNGGPNIFETFNKGPSPSNMGASMGNFQGIELTFTP